MSVIADTSQVEMTPYVATAERWSEVHKVTAVSRSDLEANTAFVGASVGVSVGCAVAAFPSARAKKKSVTILRDSPGACE